MKLVEKISYESGDSVFCDDFLAWTSLGLITQSDHSAPGKLDLTDLFNSCSLPCSLVLPCNIAGMSVFLWSCGTIPHNR